MLDEGVSQLIRRIYGGAADPVAWDAVMNELRVRSRSRFVLLSSIDTADLARCRYSMQGAEDGRFLDGTQAYINGYNQHDPMLIHALRHPEGRQISLVDAVGDADYATHPFARWARETLNMEHAHVCYAAPEDDLALGLSFNTPAGADPHGRDEQRLLAMLFDHVEQALRLAARPPRLDAEDEAQLLLDRRGRVLVASPAAEALLARGDGLDVADDMLTAPARDGRMRLDAAVRSALDALSHGSAGGALALPRPSGRADLLLTIRPVPAPSGTVAHYGAAARVRIIDPEARVTPMSADRWRALFGLTAREAELARALMTSADGLPGAADALAITHGTARVHLSRIFDKVGVHSQAELGRLLARL